MPKKIKPQKKIVSINITELFWEFNLPPGEPSELGSKPIKAKKIIKAIDEAFLIHFPGREFVSDIFYHEIKINGQKDFKELWLLSNEFEADTLYAIALRAAKNLFPHINYDTMVSMQPEETIRENYVISL